VWCGWEAQFRVAYDPGAIDTRPGHTLMENEEERRGGAPTRCYEHRAGA
jgi:hypothetical protein